MRAVQLAGHGRWFGALLDGEMRSGLGLMTDGSGVARLRSVGFATAETQVTLERAA